MISWFRTYQSKIGKMPELIALSEEAAKYLESTHGLKVEIYTQLGGDPLKIGLLGRYDDLGAVDKLNQKMSQLESRLASTREGAERAPSVARRPVVQSEGRFYEVRRGDTLFRIANNHGLFIPFVIATGCLVIATATQFHANPVDAGEHTGTLHINLTPGAGRASEDRAMAVCAAT